MSNYKNYKTNLKKWDKTLNAYLDWVASSELRKYFSKEIKINNFSLWWVTNICTKDNMLKNKWYYDLKDCLTEKKNIKYNKTKFYLIFYAKLIKNFVTHFFWFIAIKFLSFSRLQKIKRKNCFHSTNFNIIKNKGFYIDRCYGHVPFIRNANDNFFLVDIARKRHFIFNIFKRKNFKKNIPYIIADEYLSIFDVLYIYYKTIIYFFKLKIFLNKNKKLFFIKNVDCRNVLEPFLLMSFDGEIQNSIFKALSVNKFLKDKKIKLFITYVQFNPGARSLCFFVRNIKNPPKIISIQHGHSNKNLMYFSHKKNEFTKNKSLEGLYYSPIPDFYLTQGSQFNQLLNSYFPNKTKIIGCLKYDIYKFKKNKNNVKLNKIKFLDKKKNKKIILLCPSIGDELNILDYLKHSVNFNFRFILSPHPILRKKNIIKKYSQELGNKCHLEVYDDVSTFDLLSISDLLICGFSTVAYEALFFNVQSIRIVNSDNPQFFDLRDNLPVADSPNSLKKILNARSFLKTKNLAIKKLKKNYFYKLDNKAHQRFWNFVKEQKL
tara:strand:- start:308 stop:1948 length:1641 start_codon:yes stop_codon:yes gene_type:complete